MSKITLHQARLGFKFAKQTENKSPKTIEWYDSLLDRFEQFLSTRQSAAETQPAPLLADITTHDLRQFIAHLQGKDTIWENHKYHKPVAHPLSPHTIRGFAATLSAFFHWAVAEDLITTNPFDRVQRPKVPRKIKERFTEEDIKKLLDACRQYTDTVAARNRAIVLVLLDTGIRASELVTLSLDRLDLEHGRAHVTGKGLKDRQIQLGRTARKVLWTYVAVHRPQGAGTDRVFLTREGEPMTVNRLQKMLQDLGERAGVPHCHPHRFRHTAARLLARNGCDPFTIQCLFGHEDLRTTRLYVELEREDVEKMAERSSPVDHWGLK